MDKISESIIRRNLVTQLEYIGENPHREGLLDTPDKVIRLWSELFSGYNKDPKDVFTTFDNKDHYRMVLCRDIEMFSMCEHHMLPFYGTAHVAYIPAPGQKIIGLSKLAQLVDIFSRRLQTQERIGEQVTDALMEHLKPQGAACIIKASHMCMRMRGVTKQNSTIVTSSMRGVFIDDPATRKELLDLIQI